METYSETLPPNPVDSGRHTIFDIHVNEGKNGNIVWNTSPPPPNPVDSGRHTIFDIHVNTHWLPPH